MSSNPAPDLNVGTIIPPDVVTQEDVAQWYKTKQELDALKFKEHTMRIRIMRFYFTEPKEGTNTYLLPDQYQLKGTHVINREVDPGALDANRLRYQRAGINVDALVEYKPSLKIREYRTLTEEQRKLFDESLVIKEGSPQLKIDPPSKRVSKAPILSSPTDLKEAQ